MQLMPFFTYYGGKYRAALQYPRPIHCTIIEPFAGAAGYSTRWHDRNIILIEKDPELCALWRYLIKVLPSEIRSLPLLEKHQNLNDITNITEEGRLLIGRWMQSGRPTARTKFSDRTKNRNLVWGITARERVASQVNFIRHWTIIEGSYEIATFEDTATWFIDPPYQCNAGRAYRFNHINFENLANYCKSRQGQVIVCEQDGANWLDFSSFAELQGANGYKKEVIWYRERNQ